MICCVSFTVCDEIIPPKTSVLTLHASAQQLNPACADLWSPLCKVKDVWIDLLFCVFNGRINPAVLGYFTSELVSLSSQRQTQTKIAFLDNLLQEYLCKFSSSCTLFIQKNQKKTQIHSWIFFFFTAEETISVSQQTDFFLPFLVFCTHSVPFPFVVFF